MHIFMLVIGTLLPYMGLCQGFSKLADFESCKLTQEGTEYFGTKSNTVSGWKCQHWESVISVKKLFTNILDIDFPEGSRKHARNYCRNPTRDPGGPWCYTLDADMEKQSCGIPFCNFQECRHSGPGQEYQGHTRQSSSSNQCLAWVVGSTAKDLSLEGKIRCANPSADPAGPWCMVFGDHGEQSELCDVPICDFPACGRVAMSVNHSIFSEVGNKKNLTFSMRMWHPELVGMIGMGPHLFLSSLASPEGSVGFQLEIGLINHGGGLVLRRWPAPKDPIEYEDVVVWKPKRPPNVPSASAFAWTKLWITWDDKDIRVGEVGLEDIPRVSMKIHKEKINFYSLSGPRAMWEFNECCEVHATSDQQFAQSWPLQATESGHELQFNTRAFSSAVIMLYHGPNHSRAAVQVTLQPSKKNAVHLVNTNGTLGEELTENYEKDVFEGPFQWSEFSLSVFGDMLQVIWRRSSINTVLLMEVKHSIIHGIRWFSIGSDNSMTYWTLQCKPPENDTMVEAVLPECSSNRLGLGYIGHQSASAAGHPCIPWNHEAVPDAFKLAKLFPEGSVDDAMNYCRNPDKDGNGTWCFTSAPEFPREVCNVRECQYQNCRMAGTGNDYMGSQNVTVSGRSCQAWLANTPHKIPKSLHNVTRYPERDLTKASNFCRNPNRNMTGSWCYTTDPYVPFDVCDVRNCEKREECTLVTVQSPPSSNVYILPKWRSEGLKFWLKEWDPEKPDGIKFSIKPFKGNEYYLLMIGSQENNAIEMFVVKNEKKELKKEKIVPHIIPIGKWGGFWLRVDTGLVELGYENVPDAIFKWKDRSLFPITPMLLGFGSIYENLIGLHFPCDGSECHTQHFESSDLHKTHKLQENIYPINLWKPQTVRATIGEPQETVMEFYARGDQGSILMVQLCQFPGHEIYSTVMFGQMIIFTLYKGRDYVQAIFEEIGFSPINKEWKKYTIRFNETDMTLSCPVNGKLRSWNHTHKDATNKNLFYYFIVKTRGSVDWSVNCEPADLNGTPRNGGWSSWGPWNCSVDCGGGQGFRKRTCTNPEPNVFGKYCSGSDTKHGRCNKSPCGQASHDVVKAVKAYLHSNHYSYLLREGENFNHTCHPPLYKKLLAELKNATLTWTKNGLQLKENLNATTLSFNSVNASDSGVYTLVVLGARSRTTLCVATLAVLTTLQTREGETLRMPSNALALGSLYPDIKLRWVLGTHTWRNYGVTPFAALETLEIRDVNFNHSGYWSCVVTQIELGFSWTSAWYHVEVHPSRTFAIQLMEDPMFSKVFGTVGMFGGETAVVAAAIVLALLAVTAVFLGATFFMSWQRRKL